MARMMSVTEVQSKDNGTRKSILVRRNGKRKRDERNWQVEELKDNGCVKGLKVKQ